MFFDVTVWAARGEACGECLAKGSPVAVELEWREWEAQDGTRRQATSVVGDAVEFLGSGGREAA